MHNTHNRPTSKLPPAHGFTLVELMVALVLIGIATTLAYPSYHQYLLRAHRSHAKNQLLQVAQWMERAATASGLYPHQTQHANVLEAMQNQLSTPQYAITIHSPDGSSFTVSAIAQQTQRQDLCGSLHLHHTGERSISHTPASSTMTALQCWER